MDLILQALLMGIVQGLTEFVPISSSGHLIIVPFLAGWDDEFITSLAFTVMLHVGTLVALLIYFWDDWLRLVPAGLAALRDRSLAGDPDRRLAWVLVAATIPAAVAGLLLEGLIASSFRSVGIVALMLVVGGVIMLLADRLGRAHAEHRGRDVPDRPRHRDRTGTRAGPGYQPLRRLDHRRPHRRSGPRAGGQVRVPDGHADHARGDPVRGTRPADR